MFVNKDVIANEFDEHKKLLKIRSDKELRDFFAGMALQGLIASHANPATTSLPNTETDFKTLSTISYKYADAMMKARDE